MKWTLFAALFLAGCGGGGSVTPPVTTQATSAPNVAPNGFATVVSPANGVLTNSGETITLANAVPVYNAGTKGAVVATNSNGMPTAPVVGTTSSAVDLNEKGGTIIHAMYVNNPAIECAFGQTTQSGPANSLSIAYFVCYGNPFA